MGVAREVDRRKSWKIIPRKGVPLFLVITDIKATALYADTLRAVDALNVERRRLGWRFWWGNPFVGTTLLAALKAPV